MGHLPEIVLHKWKRGDKLFADELTHDFAALHMLAEAAADLAAKPDPNAARALARVLEAERRLAALEHHNIASARELGTRQFTPLATTGALIQRVNALADPLHEAAQELRAEVSRREASETEFDVRLTIVEGVPRAPTLRQFEELKADLASARDDAAAAHRQCRKLRVELALAGQARERAEERRDSVVQAEYDALKARMDGFEASTAAADVHAMRAEVARLQRLIADTDRKDALNRQFAPRSALLYLMLRVERLEKGKP